ESKSLKAIYAINKDSLFILGNGNKIYCTGDGCLNFNKVELGNDINNNLYCINKIDNNNLLFLASHPVETEDREIVYTSTSVYKLRVDNFFRENFIKISPEKYKDELIANMQTAAENEASSLHPLSTIEKVDKKKISESLEANKSLTEEYEFTIKLKGAILGINEFLVKLKVTGKIEFNIFGKIKYTTKDLKVTYNEKIK
ncbi:MAG: hypothetical protein NTU73_00325, partial [Ignavibacteriae bacterium]|nr:hypothetical protein [Ignavibacteriota bacterium]